MNVLTDEAFTIFANMPPFYRQAFTYFCEVKFKPEKEYYIQNPGRILNQIIWNNDLFKINNKYLIFPNWIKSNIIYIKDMLKKMAIYNLTSKLKID